jgi:hypothetical protein
VLFVSYGETGPAGSRLLRADEIAAGPSASRRIYFHAIEGGDR